MSEISLSSKSFSAFRLHVALETSFALNTSSKVLCWSDIVRIFPSLNAVSVMARNSILAAASITKSELHLSDAEAFFITFVTFLSQQFL